MKTIADLKKLAKENNLKITSRLRRKNEIIDFLRNSGVIGLHSRKSQPTLLDEKVPLLNAEILIPQQVPLKPPRTKRLAKLANDTVETFSNWLNWLKDSGKEVVKKSES